MATTGLDVFDRTVQKTNLWLKELGEELHWEERNEVYHALRTVLHALRDRLPPEEAADLAAQLPLLVKGVFFDEWKPGATPLKIRDRQEFLDRIREPMQQVKPNVDAERTTQVVFRFLTEKVSRGELEDILRALPEDLAALWPETVEARR